MIALVDADIVCFRVAAACEKETEDVVRNTVDSFLGTILEEVKADESRLFLSPPKEDNFRYKLWPLYKANRIGKPKPHWLPLCREYLIEKHGAEIAAGCEADDMLGIVQTQETHKQGVLRQGNGSVICSIDKDMLTIKGRHYNFVKKEFIEINKYSAAFNFWKQMLVGDSADNVIGVKGMGEKRSAAALEQLEQHEWAQYVQDQYDNDTRFMLNYNLLRIWTKPNMLFFDGEDGSDPQELFDKRVVELEEIFQEVLNGDG